MESFATSARAETGASPAPAVERVDASSPHDCAASGRFTASADAEVTQCSPAKSQTLRQNLPDAAGPLRGFLQNFPAAFLSQHHKTVQDLAHVVDGPPKIMLFAIDLYKNPVQVPSPAASPHTLS